MKKKLLLVIPAVVLIVGVGYWKFKTRDYVDPLRIERQARTEQSLKVINKGMDQDPNVIYRAMVSIAQEANPETLAKVQAFETSKVALVRAGVAYVLAVQNAASSADAIDRLAQDPESIVRSHLINGARVMPSPEKEKILKTLLANKKITDIEKYEAMGVLYVVSKDRREAEQFLDEMISASQREAKSRVGDFLILQINQVAPDNKKTIALNQRALNHTNPAVVASALRSLASKKDPSVVSNFSKWIHSSDAMVKRAAIESLHLICPSQRWQWISEGFEADHDFASRSVWILAAERLKGAEAKDFLDHALLAAEKNGNTNEAKAIQAAITRLISFKGEAPCTTKH